MPPAFNLSQDQTLQFNKGESEDSYNEDDLSKLELKLLNVELTRFECLIDFIAMRNITVRAPTQVT